MPETNTSGGGGPKWWIFSIANQCKETGVACHSHAFMHDPIHFFEVDLHGVACVLKCNFLDKQTNMLVIYTEKCSCLANIQTEFGHIFVNTQAKLWRGI
jgi:hypothetical protein